MTAEGQTVLTELIKHNFEWKIHAYTGFIHVIEIANYFFHSA